MNINTGVFIGSLLIVGGILGYIAGVYAVYPGRSLSLTAVLVGITLVGISKGLSEEEPT